jgi:predicted ATPase/DNA-binding CsgD family transcriptional regulator
MQLQVGVLPEEVTGFVGRRAELARLAGLLAEARLVTAIGPGGVGKTRVSLRAAALAAVGYRDGVYLAELSELHDAELLPHTVADCLGLPQSDAQLDAVLGFLRERQLLLILDTCEHLLDGCAMLADVILRTAPGVTVLATSRQSLDVPGEHTCAIPPLPVADDAVALFAQRAAAVVAGFAVTKGNRADVIRVCQRLDGIPLAIELAAVRLRALSLPELAGRLESRFGVLAGGRRTALPRHKTLRTAIEWSHDLCTPAERQLWARLSVFAGSFGVAAAEEVCGGASNDASPGRDEVLGALIGLVDKSVVLRQEGDDGARYRLLDTLREFGAEQLAAAGAEADLRTRHVARYLAMAEHFAEHVFDDEVAQYRAVVREHANIRAALEYALILPGQDSAAARLITALHVYWDISDSDTECLYWLARILDRFPGPSAERAEVLLLRCHLRTDTQADGREGIAIAEQLGESLIAARGYLYLNMSLIQADELEEARQMGAIADDRLREAGDRFDLLYLDAQMAQLHAFAGEPELALERCELGLRRTAGSGEVWQTSYLHQMAGFALLQQDRNEEGAEALCKALTMKAELDDFVGVAMCLEMIGWQAARLHRYDRAAWLLGAAAAQFERPGDQTIDDYPFMLERHRQAETAACDALGADRYAERYRAGYEHPLQQLLPLVTGDADKLPPAEAAPASAGDRAPLTSREREIAAMVAAGLSNRDIAEQLVISKRTVDAHVEHIYTKLDISSRVQLTNWLMDYGDQKLERGHGGQPGQRLP